MANLIPIQIFDDVYRLETTDRNLAGENGILNVPFQNLTNRTEFLNEELRISNSNIRFLELSIDNLNATLIDRINNLNATLLDKITNLESDLIARIEQIELELSKIPASIIAITGVNP